MISSCGAARDIQTALLEGLGLSANASTGHVLDSAHTLQLQVNDVDSHTCCSVVRIACEPHTHLAASYKASTQNHRSLHVVHMPLVHLLRQVLCGPGNTETQTASGRRTLMRQHGSSAVDMHTATGHTLSAHAADVTSQDAQRSMLQEASVVPCTQRHSVVNISVDLRVPLEHDAAAARDAAVKVLYELYRHSAAGGRCPVAILPDLSTYTNILVEMMTVVSPENQTLWQQAAANLDPQLLAIAAGSAPPQPPAASITSPALCPEPQVCSCFGKKRQLWALVFLGLGMGALAGMATGIWWERWQQARDTGPNANAISDDEYEIASPKYAGGGSPRSSVPVVQHMDGEGTVCGRSSHTSKARSSRSTQRSWRDSWGRSDRGSGCKKDRDSGSNKAKKPQGMMFQSTTGMKVSSIAHAASAVQFMQQLAAQKAAQSAAAGTMTSTAGQGEHQTAHLPLAGLQGGTAAGSGVGHHHQSVHAAVLQSCIHMTTQAAAVTQTHESSVGVDMPPEGVRAKPSLRGTVGLVLASRQASGGGSSTMLPAGQMSSCVAHAGGLGSPHLGTKAAQSTEPTALTFPSLSHIPNKSASDLLHSSWTKVAHSSSMPSRITSTQPAGPAAPAQTGGDDAAVPAAGRALSLSRLWS